MLLRQNPSPRRLMEKWLSVIGIGENGLPGLSPVARALVDQAEVITGGTRHLAMLPPDDPREKLLWTSPIEASVDEILKRQGQAVCVLASGDPLCYGVGVTLLRKIAIAQMTIIPSPSAFSLACARLGWALTEVETLSLCGRDSAVLSALLYSGARLLVLSEDRRTPELVAKLLTDKGFGKSQMTVLEHMGGAQERIIQGIASEWSSAELADLDFADLNTLAIACSSDPDAQCFSGLAGLPDAAYRHDGQLTKREVRAITLAALAPLPGQLLWDVGAGCGSISIEWMRSHRQCRAIAIEQHPERLGLIADNAAALGTPALKIVAGQAPDVLVDLPVPDAIFIGGGITADNLLQICWKALKPGGRLVVNAVTVESEQVVFQGQQTFGGVLTRVAIQRAEPVGRFLGWKAMAPITQWAVLKPRNT
jgi:precorrin-6B C5,15-methyltransferase / cobalt-precorrin-6B C5,C15-methyltransferase